MSTLIIVPLGITTPASSVSTVASLASRAVAGGARRID
jgi:hypothetical protein